MDDARHTAYQQLRGDIFVRSLGWSLPIDELDREKDQYDELKSPWINTHCVFISGSEQEENLLGGVRVFELSDWGQSMTFNEFRLKGMIPDSALEVLQNTYQVRNMIELTRLCVVRNKKRISLDTSLVDFTAVRDYVYSCAYVHAEKVQCRYALAIVDYAYYVVCKRSKFIFDELYTRFERHQKGGYALIVIDLSATIMAIQSAGDYERAQRMVQLCQNPSLFLKG
ncbi:hypothetical protein KDH_02810 [Dictyobacter sp. S3.2.2.5]|uniref:Acyl-homoserine-lactone synthase n=2 Tax=Dictyobacter halimunensis TaxID=3026934 RepID=A0ABQ6FLU7_9CHLR|nr:hypothetical protein KDH_02810 [Dictyobacter sp. S3.2.2.5]